MDNNDSLKDLYSTPEDRIDTILDRSNVDFWRCLRRAMKGIDIKEPEEVIVYVAGEFGVQLELSSGDFGSVGYKPRARIIDEQKYLFFLLKYQS